jgi:hypothetical protein
LGLKTVVSLKQPVLTNLKFFKRNLFIRKGIAEEVVYIFAA